MCAFFSVLLFKSHLDHCSILHHFMSICSLFGFPLASKFSISQFLSDSSLIEFGLGFFGVDVGIWVFLGFVVILCFSFSCYCGLFRALFGGSTSCVIRVVCLWLSKKIELSSICHIPILHITKKVKWVAFITLWVFILAVSECDPRTVYSHLDHQELTGSEQIGFQLSDRLG